MTPDRIVLHLGRHIVPVGERADWLRFWQAELWHRRHPANGRPHPAPPLYPGLLRDALWLRSESWRCAFSGTALLCLATLTMLACVAALPLLACLGSPATLFSFLEAQSPHLLIEATLTTLVGFAIAPRSVEHSPLPLAARLLRGHLFQGAKIILLQSLAFLLSLDITQPFHSVHPFTAEFLQPQLCTLFALLALRWCFHDQDARCRDCLRSLGAPTRCGRPSWNFLESNGTQLSCGYGHGLLSIPEMETSWRPSSEWIAQ